MYSKSAASKIRERFWQSFGKYMQLVPSASGEKINWVNYKTGIKGVRIHTQCGSSYAEVAIRVSHPQENLRNEVISQFSDLIVKLHTATSVSWHQMMNLAVNKETTSLIYSRLEEVSVFRESDWPAIISYFKTSLMLFDREWLDKKDIVEMILNQS